MRGAACIAGTVLLATVGLARAEDLPEAIRASGERALLTVHAEGAQIYQCKVDASGALGWVFREPIASLFQGGETVGRHYAGPSWEFTAGGSIVGRVVAKAPGGSGADVPWLKLEASSHSGGGALTDSTTIQRINTRGGALTGSCEAAGAFRSVPYSADYVFLKKEN